MRTEHVTDIANGFKELIKCCGPDPAQMRFQFRERHFDRLEVWAVWRHEQDTAALVLQRLSRRNISESGEVAEDHELARFQSGCTLGAAVSFKGQSVHSLPVSACSHA